MIALVVFALTRLDDIHGALEKIVTVDHVAVESLYKMQGAARERGTLVQQILLTHDPFEREELIQKFYELGSVFTAGREALEQLNLPDEEKRLFEKLRAQTRTAGPLQNKIINLIQGGRNAEAQVLLLQEALPAQGGVVQALTEILEHELKEAAEMADVARNKRRQAIFFLVISCFVAIVLSAITTLFVTSRLSSLVTNLARTSDELKLALRDLQFKQQALDQHNIVSITNAAGDITYANQKFIDICGYTREELLGQNHRLIRSGYHPPAFFQEMWGTITSGRVWYGVMCNKAKNGAHYWVTSTIVPFLDDNGLPYQYISIRSDITQIKDAENLLQQNKGKLEAMVHERTADLANANSALQIEVDRRKALEEHLRDLAITDTLTGIFNRRKFDDALTDEMGRSGRYGTPLSLLMFDIDFFKRINDAHGHLVGDTVLQTLGRFITGKIRSLDMFARYGGEEFAILTPGTNIAGCCKLAGKLRVAIEQHEFPEAGPVTCSFGVTEFQRGDTAESFVRRANVALYRAKKNGRNRVEEE